jgi:hypothetical protein
MKPHIYMQVGVWWCHFKPYLNSALPLGYSYVSPYAAYSNWRSKQ